MHALKFLGFAFCDPDHSGGHRQPRGQTRRRQLQARRVKHSEVESDRGFGHGTKVYRQRGHVRSVRRVGVTDPKVRGLVQQTTRGPMQPNQSGKAHLQSPRHPDEQREAFGLLRGEASPPGAVCKQSGRTGLHTP